MMASFLFSHPRMERLTTRIVCLVAGLAVHLARFIPSARLEATLYYETPTTRNSGGAGSMEGMMPPDTATAPLTADQRGAEVVVFDTCADVRRLYSLVALRKEKGKLGEVEELAQETDATQIHELMAELDDYWDAAEALGVPTGRLVLIAVNVLPPEMSDQLLKGKQPSNIVIGTE